MTAAFRLSGNRQAARDGDEKMAIELHGYVEFPETAPR